MRKSILVVLGGALIFRLLLAPWAYHWDATQFLNWGKNLQELGTEGFYSRDTPDAGPPNYTPALYLALLTNQWIYKAAKEFFWIVNIAVPPFPSNFIPWFDLDNGRIFFNKLLAIFFDLGIGYLIYLFIKDIKGAKIALVSSAAFLFSPPIWYNSAVWGQTESLFALPLLASFFAILKKRQILAPVLFTTAFLIKASVLLVLPVFLFLWLRTTKINSLVKGAFISLILFYLVHIPFQLENTTGFITKIYREDVKETLGYLTANAFNLWAFVFGFEPKPDSTLFLGIPAFLVGAAIFGGFTMFLLWTIQNKMKPHAILLGIALVAFVGFLFLTRIHERYFYLVLLFLAPLVGLSKKLRNVFWVLSGIHLVNLYHFWWVPRINFLVELLSARIVEQVLILANFAVFFWLLRIFQKKYAKA